MKPTFGMNSKNFCANYGGSCAVAVLLAQSQVRTIPESRRGHGSSQIWKMDHRKMPMLHLLNPAKCPPTMPCQYKILIEGHLLLHPNLSPNRPLWNFLGYPQTRLWLPKRGRSESRNGIYQPVFAPITLHAQHRMVRITRGAIQGLLTKQMHFN